MWQQEEKQLIKLFESHVKCIHCLMKTHTCRVFIKFSEIIFNKVNRHELSVQPPGQRSCVQVQAHMVGSSFISVRVSIFVSRV